MFPRTSHRRFLSRPGAVIAAFLGLVGVICPRASDAAGPELQVSSPAFASGATIPVEFTCSGGDHSPALGWVNAPAETKSFALIADDPDAPSGTFTHWVIFDIPGGSSGLPARVPPDPTLSDGTTQGTNSFGSVGYRGPCPPPGGPHHYRFVLYALDSMSGLKPDASADMLTSAIRGHVKATAEVVGTFSR